MNKVIAIVGPTASGKTGSSIQLAKRLDTEIVAMDSMQIYRHMDIGTAKPTALEMEGIPHHMLDVVEPSDPYSVAQYQKAAMTCIGTIHEKGKIPVLVGGTGLYLRALSTDMHLGDTLGNDAIREKYEAFANEYGNKALHERLNAIDAKTAARLHENDVRRVVRALEIYEMTGIPLSERETSLPKSSLDITVFGVSIERNTLIERINRRVDMMLEQGMVQEVEKLLHMGVSPESQAMQGIGYKEIIPYLKGDLPLESVIETVKIRTRQYAKRQMTWFRGTPGIRWEAPDKIVQSMLEV